MIDFIKLYFNKSYLPAFTTSDWALIPRAAIDTKSLLNTSHSQNSERCLEKIIWLNDSDKSTMLLYKDTNGQIQFNFDIKKFFRDILYENYTKPKQAFTRFLPIHYHKIPNEIRPHLGKIIYKFTSFPKFPAPFFEPVLEIVYYILKKLNLSELLGDIVVENILPPGNYVLLTHDVDTYEGQLKLREFIKLEQFYGIKSICFFPLNHYPLDYKLFDYLQVNGFKLGAHGDNHDDRLAFLPEKAIRRRMDRVKPLISDYDIDIFRSPNLYRTKTFLQVISEFFKYDSSIPDTSITGGCAFTKPFLIDGKGKSLIELPINLPIDAELLMCNLPPSEILKVWMKKTELLCSIGSFIVLCVHPDPHFSGNKAMFKIYEEIIKFFIAKRLNFCIPK